MTNKPQKDLIISKNQLLQCNTAFTHFYQYFINITNVDYISVELQDLCQTVSIQSLPENFQSPAHLQLKKCYRSVAKLASLYLNMEFQNLSSSKC